MINLLQKVFSWVCHDFDSELVNSLKGVSSRILRRDFSKDISKILWKGVLFSPSCFAGSCGGAPLDVIKKYIQNQDSPRMQESQEECLTSLS